MLWAGELTARGLQASSVPNEPEAYTNASPWTPGGPPDVSAPSAPDAMRDWSKLSERRTPIHTLSELLCDSTAFRKETETNEKNDLKEQHCGTSLGGPVVKNLSANAGNRDWSPDLGRSHVPKSSSASGPQLLKPVCSRAQELQLLSPEPRICPPQDKWPQLKACNHNRVCPTYCN
ncbi:hypothetical protein MJT46_002336 [Ovis ammon polii x Ovis aries]|nr:hypothetical protein MJT46_002336 [Ovis ammon polii x Ovis aries]